MKHERFGRRPLFGAGLTVAVTVVAAVTLTTRDMRPPTARQVEVAEKGRTVMPFDLDRTTHRFTKTPQGGVQSVVADDPTDQSQIRLIREHLNKEYRRFRAGEFGDPASIHGTGMPGLAQLSRGYSRIQMVFRHVPAGAQLTFTTADTSLISALHAWFDAQVSDHGTHAEHG